MQRAAALKKLQKLFGKKLGYRVDPKAPSADEREAAKAELPAASAERERLKREREARAKALLDADAEYQSLSAAYKAAREKTDILFGLTHHFKFTVGAFESGFFLVKARGDSWEQIIDQLTRDKPEAA